MFKPNYYNLFALKGHTHEEFSDFGQENDSYALIDHNHDETYAEKTHNHDEIYSKTTHGHTDLSLKTLKLNDKDVCIGDLKTLHSSTPSYFKIGNIMVAYGKAEFTSITQDVTMKQTITYPVAFSLPPFISLTANSTSPHVISLGASSVTSSDFSLNMHRTSSLDTTVFWFAIGSC